ncbi:protein of unknown function DUF324 [Thalassoporum mexicanum PCC 7367]|uniref:RAMP superfamily CRISPR-associated protein n=1 Tax=Thalassoporum mexicanum TaxID=3457544 RepID=UPI00029FDCCD|nr:RAMP superfamily CRISPR-associated protein [Pseudanabaena sp. PCC 7367]AFY68742.1 protein of unknown function DUF324 [Pseudanabaena sp. PCC 7367]
MTYSYKQPNVPKPYDFVPLPSDVKRCDPAHPYELLNRPIKKDLSKAGQNIYRHDLWHGALHVTLSVKTSLHVSTGLTVMGTDIKHSAPLIKTMESSPLGHLRIPGSSFKGVVRSVFEAITRSCLCKTKARAAKKYKECEIKEKDKKENKSEICPACRVFGSMGWQGLISIFDCHCIEVSSDICFMPNLHGPGHHMCYDEHERVRGRKFYYNFDSAATESDKGVDTQVAVDEYKFKTKLQFQNLSLAELGTLLIALGQDQNNSFNLKVGGGKPIGFGTVSINVEPEIFNGDDIKSRYFDLQGSMPKSDSNSLIVRSIALAHQNLVQANQLAKLVSILGKNASWQADALY